jgi:hypothetical protein
MSEHEWKEVPQGRRSARFGVGLGIRTFLRLALRQRSGETILELSMNDPLRQDLNWWPNDRLGFSRGVGSMSGHLKFYKQGKGRKFCILNNSPLLIARFIAPSEWKVLKGDLEIKAFSSQNGELVAQVPALHDDFFVDTDAGTGPAGHEVAA